MDTLSCIAPVALDSFSFYLFAGRAREEFQDYVAGEG